MPQSWFQKNAKLKDAVASIQNDVVGQSLAFARAIAAQEPGLNETVLAVEAMCFFLHAFNFIIARNTNSRLRRGLYVPTVNRICDVFGAMLGETPSPDHGDRTRQAIDELIVDRDALYAGEKNLLGEDGQDTRTALHAAAELIAREVHAAKPAATAQAAKLALLRGINELRPVERVNLVGSLLD